MTRKHSCMSQCVICKVACSCKHRQSCEALSCRISCQTHSRWNSLSCCCCSLQQWKGMKATCWYLTRISGSGERALYICITTREKGGTSSILIVLENKAPCTSYSEAHTHQRKHTAWIQRGEKLGWVDSGTQTHLYAKPEGKKDQGVAPSLVHHVQPRR